MSYLSIGDLSLYYEIHGTGEPLVLLHGGFGAVEMFGPILPALAEHRQVIAVDLQGHGRTADVDRPIRYEALAEDIAALIGHLGLTHVDVMGYSFGGGVALRLAIQHRDLVAHLIAVSSPHRRSAWYPEVLAGMAALDATFADTMMQSPVYPLYAKLAPRVEDFPILIDKMGDLLRTEYDWSADLAALDVPALLVFGDADSIPPIEIVDFFRLLGGGLRDAGWDGSGSPRSRLAILPYASHYDILQSPLLVPAIVQFLG
jgi:pimeloyl-ACP methyl ester carboxylesterase